MLGVNGNSCEGAIMDSADGLYEISMGRAAQGEFLSLLGLMEGSQIVT